MANQPIFRWDDLALLLQCQRSGTATAAAQELSLDPATVSRRLTQLERDLGLVLFQRGRDGLVATAALQALLPSAEAAEAAVLAFSQAVRGVEVAVAGPVRLTMPPGVAESLLLPILPNLRSRHPQLQLEIDASTSFVDLARREADLALRTRRPEHGDLVAIRLFQAKMAVMGAPHWAQTLPPMALRELPWLGWDRMFDHLPEARWLAAHAPESAVVLRSNSLPFQLAAARAGLGAVLCPEPHGRQVGLVPVPLVPPDAERVAALPVGDLWMVCHRAVREVPRVRAVWQFLVDEVAQLRAAGVL